jgi:leader peptidase (prepilin peptidase)/N-methyltransferase
MVSMSPEQRVVFLIFSGLLGLLVGSFLNVCIFRLPRNCMSLVRPRSRCPKCLRLIAWYDNIPVASWLVLGGKCRGCRLPISPRYPLVELLTGALFLYAGWRELYGSSAPGPDRAIRFVLETAFLGAMMACTFIDLDFRILPDEITIPGTLVGLGASAMFPFLHEGGMPLTISSPHLASLAVSALGALVGGGAIYGVGVLGKLLFRKEAMGLGDVKYMAMVGALLGWKGVLFTFLIACLCGALFGIGKLLAVRRMGYVPFGPFLSLGALVMLFWPHLVYRALRWYMALFQPPA